MRLPGALRRLFVHAPPDPVTFWRSRATESGSLSVMWRNAAYNELAQRDQWAAIERNLPGNRNAVLDLGCGTGRLSSQLAQQFSRYVGVDLDEMVDEARRRNPELAGEYVSSHIQEYEFPPNTFDLVLSMACLGNACRADELPDVARRMYDATVSGGRIVLIDAFHRLPVLARVCRVTAADVMRSFEALGATVEEWSGIHFIPVRLVVARSSFAKYPRVTRSAYVAGEVALGIWPRMFSDYKVLSFRK